MSIRVATILFGGTPIWSGHARGADILTHFRATFEASLRSDENCPALLVLDLDLKNAFPSLEWDAIRDAVHQFLPKFDKWVAWCHQKGSLMFPNGKTTEVDRGAEEGDPLGPLFCGLVLAGVRRRVSERMRNEAPDVQYHDVWYMDDGQVFITPSGADVYLRLLDEELARVGANRGCKSNGDEIKSIARLVGHPESVRENRIEWLTNYVQDTCRILEPNSVVQVLGIDVVASNSISNQFEEVSESVRELQDLITSIGDVGTELVLIRRCADVCKITHLLRAFGPYIDRNCLERFDQHLDIAINTLLSGPIGANAAGQAHLGVAVGGLGLRRAIDLAFPAFIAARVSTHPFLSHLGKSLVDVGSKELRPGGSGPYWYC